MSNVLDDFDRASQPAGKSRGCLYGCLIGGGVMVALLLCGGGAAYWYLAGTLEKYTAEAAVELPQVEFTPEQMAELDQRLKTFSATADGINTTDQIDADGETNAADKANAKATELILTADDINAIFTKQDEMKGKIFVKIEDDKLSGDISFPLSQIFGIGDRYLNAAASFNVSVQNDVLFVTLDTAEVNGESIPEKVMEQMRSKNLAEESYKKNGKALRRLKDVRIEDNKLIITLKPTEGDAEADTETQADMETEPETEPAEQTETPLA